MAEKRILWDFDDVLVPSAAAMLGNYERLYGVHVPLGQMYSRDPKVWGEQDADIVIRRNQEFMRTEEYALLPPDPAALAVLAALTEDGYRHYIGTGRPGFAHRITEESCDRNFPGLIESVVCGNYSAASGEHTMTKNEISRYLRADYHVDDHTHHVFDVAPTVQTGFLYGDYPWNQNEIVLPDNVVRVANLNQIGDVLLERVAA